MSYPQWAPDGPELERLQPDGNFRDEPPTEEELAQQRRLEELDTAREANKVGPMHPAHEQHPQWLAERGLGPEWDEPAGR